MVFMKMVIDASSTYMNIAVCRKILLLYSVDIEDVLKILLGKNCFHKIMHLKSGV